MSGADWRAFEIRELMDKRRRSGQPYLEFLRRPSLSCGIYVLPAGARDLQSPHDEDEVYFVVSGKGRVRVGGREGPAQVLLDSRPAAGELGLKLQADLRSGGVGR